MTEDYGVPASTILLLRDTPTFEVLMIERHENISFAGGALVFPGGRVDAADKSPEWRAISEGLSEIPEFAASQVAAIREAFEETGVLLARRSSERDFIDGDAAAAFSDRRKPVEDNAALFLDLIRDNELVLACDALFLFAHWCPPVGVHKKRFDTHFFAAPAPPSQRVLEDGNEATEAIWLEPSEAVNFRTNKERKVIFPTAMNLELLNLSDNVADARDFARQRKIERIQPEIRDVDGAPHLCVPDGFSYPRTRESAGNSIARLEYRLFARGGSAAKTTSIGLRSDLLRLRAQPPRRNRVTKITPPTHAGCQGQKIPFRKALLH